MCRCVTEGVIMVGTELSSAFSEEPGAAAVDVVVVGAGQAGLATGLALRNAGLRFMILEAQNKVGGAWPGYYDSLRLFSPARFSALPGMPLPGEPGRYPARDDISAYLRRY